MKPITKARTAEEMARQADGSGVDLSMLRERLLTIERDLDANSYRPGPWESFISAMLRRSAAERAALAQDVSRVSRKLHLRRRRRTMPIAAAIILELLAAVAGGALLAWAARDESSVAAIAGASLWIVSFQPLMKFFFGRAVGIGYDYAYLLGPEPRLKMKYGSYVAAAPLTRIALHLAGTVGSPLGAWLAATILPASLHVARQFCWTVLWITVATNVVGFVIGLVGVRRLGGWRIVDGSGGAAAIEIRRAIGMRA